MWVQWVARLELGQMLEPYWCGGTQCNEQEPHDGFYCTREQGHDGPHVAMWEGTEEVYGFCAAWYTALDEGL